MVPPVWLGSSLSARIRLRMNPSHIRSPPSPLFPLQVQNSLNIGSSSSTLPPSSCGMIPSMAIPPPQQQMGHPCHMGNDMGQQGYNHSPYGNPYGRPMQPGMPYSSMKVRQTGGDEGHDTVCKQHTFLRLAMLAAATHTRPLPASSPPRFAS